MALDPTALRAYAQAAQQATRPNAPSGADDHPAADFAAMVGNAVNNVESQLQSAENLSNGYAMGTSDLVDVVTAMAAAEVQLETVVSVRDQVIKAYQEILRMPI